MFNYMLVNGQVWMRSQEPEGERWVRLARAPKSDRNVRTLEKLQKEGAVPLVLVLPS